MKEFNPKECLFCGLEIKKRKNVSIKSYYEQKFCSHLCSCKYNTKENTASVQCRHCKKTIVLKKSRISDNNYCSPRCKNRQKTLDCSMEVKCDWCGKSFRRAIGTILKKTFCSRKCTGEWQSKYRIGENNYNWRGGATDINHRIRSLVLCTKWGQKVYKRDNYTCQVCGDRRGGNLNAHHIKPVSAIIIQYGLKELADAIACKELWDIANGITLCETCHIKEHKNKGKK